MTWGLIPLSHRGAGFDLAKQDKNAQELAPQEMSSFLNQISISEYIKMIINQQQQNTEAIKFSLVDDQGNEVGRAYLYLIVNDLHQLPYGFIEDVFISEKFRGQGYGKMLINQMINEAKKRDCYKLIATSRSGRDIVHHFYAMLGFIEYGKEFRLDLDSDYTP